MAELGRSRVVAVEGTPSGATVSRGAFPGARPPRLPACPSPTLTEQDAHGDAALHVCDPFTHKALSSLHPSPQHASEQTGSSERF